MSLNTGEGTRSSSPCHHCLLRPACPFLSHRWAVHRTGPAEGHSLGDADGNWGARWHYWPPHNQSGQVRCQYKKHRKKSSTTLKTVKNFHSVTMKIFERSSFTFPRISFIILVCNLTCVCKCYNRVGLKRFCYEEICVPLFLRANTSAHFFELNA